MAWSGATAVLEPDRQASRRIFISYRREDTEGHVLAFVQPLRDRLGADRIFRDIDSIPAVTGFEQALPRLQRRVEPNRTAGNVNVHVRRSLEGWADGTGT